MYSMDRKGLTGFGPLMPLQVSEHRLVNIHRRSLCDNCTERGCMSFDGSRVTECKGFKPMFVVLIKCRKCGAIFDPYINICAMDYELCPTCNHAAREKTVVTLVCHE